MQIMFDYAIRGRICVPEGSKLNNTETGIILPDGKEIKLWEKVEIHTVGEDDHTDLEYDELEALGIFYDGDCCDFDGPVEDGDRVWPPTSEVPKAKEDSRPCLCLNCMWNGGEEDLNPIKDFASRVEAGDTAVPAGECPECGCLAYLKEPDGDDQVGLNEALAPAGDE